MDLFSVDASFEHEERKAHRHASIVSHQRVADRFATFLRQAADRDDYEGRLALVDQEMRTVILAACEEAGVALGDDLELNAIHSAVLDRIAGGAFCDNCRKWKSGPKSLCVCGDSDKSDDPDASDDTEEHESSLRTAEDNLGGDGKPSPKMDKSKAGDEKSNKKRPPIDTDGGRYKTEKQDVTSPADYDGDDFLEQTEAVTDHDEDVTKGSETSGEKGPHTDTWSDKKTQADPVTSSFLREDAVRAALAAWNSR